MSQLSSILIKRTAAGGRYEDVVDVAEHLEPRFGSAANAIAQVIRESPLFRQAINEIKELEKSRRTPRRRATQPVGMDHAGARQPTSDATAGDDERTEPR